MRPAEALGNVTVMRPTPALLAALVLASLHCNRGTEPAAPGDDGPRACTMIGCMDGFSIELRPSSAWPAGEYSFAFVIDGAPVTCTGALPLPACDGGPALTCDAAGAVQIGESGCALPPESHGFSDILFTGAPKTVELTISRGGAPLLARTFTPTYVQSQPNGEGCPPVCKSASATLTLP